MNSPVASLRTCSARALKVIAVRYLRRYLRQREIFHLALDEFCLQMCRFALADNIVDWDENSMRLGITGLGDPWPPDLSTRDELLKIVQCTREISACNLYGAFQQEDSVQYLARVIELSGITLKLKLEKFGAHLNCMSWGAAITRVELRLWLEDDCDWLDAAEQRLSQVRRDRKERFEEDFRRWVLALSDKERKKLAPNMERQSTFELEALRKAFAYLCEHEFEYTFPEVKP